MSRGPAPWVGAIVGLLLTPRPTLGALGVHLLATAIAFSGWLTNFS